MLHNPDSELLLNMLRHNPKEEVEIEISARFRLMATVDWTDARADEFMVKPSRAMAYLRQIELSGRGVR